MTTRREHVRQTREYRQHLHSFETELGLHLTGWRRWKSWAHHPYSNTRYYFWGWMPHHPVWIMDESSVGEVDHQPMSEGGEGMEMGWLHARCERCGLHPDEGSGGVW